MIGETPAGLLRGFAIGILAIVLAAAGAADAQQASPRDGAAPKPNTGVIRGRVVAADTGQPLRRARVTLSASALASARAGATDLQGRYEFTDLPVGRYRVEASKGLFVPLEFGQRRAFEAGRTIELGDGVTLEKIDIALPRGGVISGRIVDDLGDPVAWARVSAHRSRYQEGRRTLAAVGRSVVTNDLGEYRLYGLPPGRYGVGTIPEPTSLDDGYRFAPAYFPGTQNPAEAQLVTVSLGEQVGGIDFVQPPGRVVRVSGRIVDSNGLPLAGASASLVNARVGSALASPVDRDGSFAFTNIAPGEYGLAADRIDPASGARSFTMVPVTVYSEDVLGLVLTFVPGSRLSGRVVTASGDPPPFPPNGVRVGVNPLPSDLPTRLPSSTKGRPPGAISPDWTFELTGVAGSSLFSLGKLPQGWMLKAVLLNGRDITDSPLAVDGTSEVSGLEFVLTDRATEVAGSVTDAGGKPVQEYTVVLFAEDPAHWTWPSRFIRTARPDQAGGFKFVNPPVAAYLVAALDYVEEGEWNDPEFLEAIRSKATRFRLGEGERKTLRLTLVRLDDGSP